MGKYIIRFYNVLNNYHIKYLHGIPCDYFNISGFMCNIKILHDDMDRILEDYNNIHNTSFETYIHLSNTNNVKEVYCTQNLYKSKTNLKKIVKIPYRSYVLLYVRKCTSLDRVRMKEIQKMPLCEIQKIRSLTIGNVIKINFKNIDCQEEDISTIKMSVDNINIVLGCKRKRNNINNNKI